MRIVVPFSPGGGVDIIARMAGPALAKQYGQQVIVDYRAGAAGIIGTEFVACAAPARTLEFELIPAGSFAACDEIPMRLR